MHVCIGCGFIELTIMNHTLKSVDYTNDYRYRPFAMGVVNN